MSPNNLANNPVKHLAPNLARNPVTSQRASIDFTLYLCVHVYKVLFFWGESFEGPEGFRKVREAGRFDFHLILSKCDFMVPSYG